MVDRIGQGSSLAREAILAALKNQARAAQDVRDAAAKIGGPEQATKTEPSGFASKLVDGLQSVNGELQAAGNLPQDLLQGNIGDFHEVAVQLKKADVSFRFAMEIRNKLIDAYREVMRMNV